MTSSVIKNVLALMLLAMLALATSTPSFAQTDPAQQASAIAGSPTAPTTWWVDTNTYMNKAKVGNISLFRIDSEGDQAFISFKYNEDPGNLKYSFVHRGDSLQFETCPATGNMVGDYLEITRTISGIRSPEDNTPAKAAANSLCGTWQLVGTETTPAQRVCVILLNQTTHACQTLTLRPDNKQVGAVKKAKKGDLILLTRTDEPQQFNARKLEAWLTVIVTTPGKPTITPKK